MWENCYYIGGSDDGILETTAGNIGVALCWEFMRTRTVRRLLNRVDLVVGGSCWWTIPEKPLNLFEFLNSIFFYRPVKLHGIDVGYRGKSSDWQ